MALTFFWRCEATALDSILDYSAGDRTGSTINGGILSTAAARVGSRGLERPASVAGGCNFTAVNIFPGNIAAPDDAVGAIAFSLMYSGAVYQLTGSNICQFRGIGTNDYLSFSTQPGGKFGFGMRKSAPLATMAVVSTLVLLPDVWYGIIGRFDIPNDKVRLEIYDAAGTLLEGIDWLDGDLAPYVPLDISNGTNGWRMGFFATSWTSPIYMDNGFVGNTYDEPIQNFFTIEDFTQYNPVTGVEGGIQAVEQNDTAAMSGVNVRTVGDIAATEQFDVAALSGTNQTIRTGTMAVTEAKDTSTFDGAVFNPAGINGGIQAVEQKDTVALSGVNVRTLGTLTATEARDIIAMLGENQKRIDGTMATLEGFDLANFEGSDFQPGIEGGIQAVEQRDTAAMSGSNVRTLGSLAALETRDAAAFSGLNQKIITGTFAVTEARDIAFFTEQLLENDMSNTIAARDGNYGIGISPEVKWKDGAPSWSRDGSDAQTLFPTSIGNAPSKDNFTNNGAERQMRLLQAISDTPAGTDILPGWASYVDVKAGEWVWALNRVTIVAEKDNPIGLGDVAAV